MRICAPLRKLARRRKGSPQQPSLNDLRAKNALAMPRDTKWAVQIGVTMSEKPEVSIIKPSVVTHAQLRSITAPTLLLIGQNETLYEPHATLRRAQKTYAAIARRDRTRGRSHRRHGAARGCQCANYSVLAVDAT